LSVEPASFAVCGYSDVYPPWNLISMPGQPQNSDPTVVFNGFDIAGTLWKWSAWTQSLSSYDPWEPQAFGAVSSSTGYWLNADMPRPISYSGYADSLTDPVDKRIQLGVGWNIVGVPFTHNTYWADWQATDGGITLPIADAADFAWVDTLAWGWDAATQALFDVNLPDLWPASDQFNSWHGYWVNSYRQIGLHAPASSSAP